MASRATLKLQELKTIRNLFNGYLNMSAEDGRNV